MRDNLLQNNKFHLILHRPSSSSLAHITLQAHSTSPFKLTPHRPWSSLSPLYVFKIAMKLTLSSLFIWYRPWLSPISSLDITHEASSCNFHFSSCSWLILLRKFPLYRRHQSFHWDFKKKTSKMLFYRKSLS